MPEQLVQYRRISQSKHKDVLIQAVVITAISCFIFFSIAAAWVKMRNQGVVGSFGVILEPTGWNLSTSIFPQSSGDPYYWTILVALANTLAVGIPAIVLSLLFGTIIGAMSYFGNRAIRYISTLYVESFRNIPVILQIVFWYTIISRGPPPRNAISFADWAFLTNHGLFLPFFTLEAGRGAAAAIIVLAALALTVAVWLLASPKMRHLTGIGQMSVRAVLLLPLLLILLYLGFFWLSWSIPKRIGFSFEGGFSVSPEYTALLFGLTIYSTAYVAEIVRGGLKSIPKGQVEAAAALALPSLVMFFQIQVPLALRLILPALGNQSLQTIKGTGLGLAVGFAELFQVSVTSANQSGRSIEFLFIMMCIYLLINYSITLLFVAAEKKLKIVSR